MPVWFPDRLGERRLLITSHNIIGCTLEWEYIVIGCTSDSCDWLFCAVALAVVIATTASTCVSASRSV